MCKDDITRSLLIIQVYLLDVLAVLLRSTMLNIMINGQAVSIFQVILKSPQSFQFHLELNGYDDLLATFGI